MFSLLFTGSIGGQAFAAAYFGATCKYNLDVYNSLGMEGSDSPGIVVKNVTLKYIDFTQWKSKSVSSSATSVEVADTKILSTSVEAFLGCFSYKFSFDWKCSTPGDGDYKSFTTDLTDYPVTVNPGATRTVQFDDCSSAPRDY